MLDEVYILFWSNSYGDAVINVFKNEEDANNEQRAREEMHPTNMYHVEKFIVK